MSALELLAQAASLCEMNSQSTIPKSTSSIHRLPKKNLSYRNEANWVKNCKVVIPEENPNSSDKSFESNELNSSSNDGKLVIDLNEQKQEQPTNSNIKSTESIDTTFNLNLLANLSTLINLPTPDNSSNDNSISSATNTTIESINNTTVESTNSKSVKKSAKKSTKKSAKKSPKKSAKKSSTDNSLIETTTNTSINSRPKRTIKPTQKLKYQLEFNEEIEIEIESRKKATKIPEHLKDESYLLKRQKNNEAAKKSRDKKNAKIDESKILYQINYEKNQQLKEELYFQIMLMKLIKNSMNSDPEFENLIKQTSETNNLNYYNKLIDFKFNDQETKEEQQSDVEM